MSIFFDWYKLYILDHKFQEQNHFKLFLFDVGLLKCMAGVSNEAILLKADYQFKGQLTENYCLQQLRDCYDILPQYFVQGQNSEIDFLLQNSVEIIPVEVKAGDSIHSNSLKKYITERKPKIAIRFSGLGYKVQENIINIPLYLVRKSKEIIGEGFLPGCVRNRHADGASL